jgi:DNA-binding transcriptional LysR family regulator
MSFMDHAPSVDPTGSLSWAHSIPFLARYNPSPWNKIIEWNSRMTEISDVRAFVRVVERGGFAAASKDLGITASAVSKLIRRLEDRLGVRLLHRTTRRVALTPEGEIYHLRARDILAAIDDAEAEVSQAGQRPRGRLRVTCVAAFAFHQLTPALPHFFARFPDIALELGVTDRVVDLLSQNVDVGIRSGSIDDGSLVARKIAEIRRGLYASPQYLDRHGRPRACDELCAHNCIILSQIPSSHRWPFQENGKTKVVQINSRAVVDSGEAALRLAIAGGGIARLADLIVADAVADGRLVPVLADTHVVEPVPLSAVYPHGKHRMPKVRAFLDFLVERFGHAPWAHVQTARKACA